MKTRIFTNEEKLLNHLVLHSNDVPSALGLLNGQMGILIVLAHYAKVRKQHQIERVSELLLENILKRLTKTVSINFADGLCGIGWGLEYLIQNDYMKGNSAELLQEVDAKIMEHDVLRIQDTSLDTGLEGTLHYVLAHLQGANRAGQRVFDKDYLENLVTRVRQLCINNQKNQDFQNLFAKLVEGINGSRKFYEFQLLRFIKPKYNPKFLTLKEGTAGQLELLINRAVEQSL